MKHYVKPKKTQKEREAQQGHLLEEAMERTQKHAEAAENAADATDTVSTAMEDILAWNRQMLDSATVLSTLLITFRKDYQEERQQIAIHEAATGQLLRERDALKEVIAQQGAENRALKEENAALTEALHTRESAAIPEPEGLPAEAYLTPEYIGEFEKVQKVPVIVEAATIKKEITIRTREGTLKGYPDDKLMRGIEGELYPCGIDIFNATYFYVEEAQEDDGNGTGA